MGADTKGTTPPALTAVQMADEIERLKALATQAVEAREAYRADQDSEELSRRSWLGLDRLHRACDPTTITGLITALTAATARLSEVTNEWESCLERDRAHRDEVREYQARLTEVERERDTLEAEIHDICPMARRQHLLGASGSDVLKEQVKYLFWLEGVRDTTNAELRAAQARIEALEGEVSTSRRAFGAISLAVAAIDKGSDNTPWQDVVARIEAIGAEMSRRLLGPSFEFVEEVRAECREWKRRASHAKRHKVKAQALARQAESALTAARTRAEGLETDLHAVASHNRELLLHLAEAQANLNDIASKLAVEDARTTRQAKTIRALEAVIREYLDALDVASNHMMRTDDDFASYEPIDARLDAAEEAMKAAITPPPATTGEEPLAKRWAHPNGPYEGCGCDYDGWGTRLRACAEHRAKEPTR